MDEIITGDLHAGLSDITLAPELFDLGEGITIKKTYAHLMAHFMMAFSQPAPGQHHPGPWRAVNSPGITADIAADLHIPSQHAKRFRIARTITFLLRFSIDPATTMPVAANYPFDQLGSNTVKDALLIPCEVFPRGCPLQAENAIATPEALGWVRDNWRRTDTLLQNSPPFSLAVDAINTGQFLYQPALLLISLWGALEALFSPSNMELKFRISALIATYLELPGDQRHKLQKDIAKLYDARSSVAHGNPKHTTQDVTDTYNLLRSIIHTIIEHGTVPSKEALERSLFGAT